MKNTFLIVAILFVYQSFAQTTRTIEVKVKDTVEYLTYSIAYSYITRLDITDLSHLYYITLAADDMLLTSVKRCLYYFETIERYEDCAYLKSLETEVNKILLKFGPPNK